MDCFSRKLKVLIVIVSSHTLDQCACIEFLTNEVVPYLKGKRAWRKSIVQQDGARPHTSNFSLEKLNELFPGEAISTIGLNFNSPFTVQTLLLLTFSCGVG